MLVPPPAPNHGRVAPAAPPYAIRIRGHVLTLALRAVAAPERRCLAARGPRYQGSLRRRGALPRPHPDRVVATHGRDLPAPGGRLAGSGAPQRARIPWRAPPGLTQVFPPVLVLAAVAV